MTRDVLRLLPFGGVVVVIFGEHSEDWMVAIGPGAPVWESLDCVRDVQLVRDPETRLPRVWGRRMVGVPLMEKHMSWCPPDYDCLIPTPQALDCLGDKAHFDGYLRKLGLSKYAPVSYKSLEEAAYPCLIKRTNLAASSGQELADSKAAAERILESDGFRGHRVILQNLIVHSDEFVTHGVAVDGRILWHTSFVYHIEDGATLLRAGVSNWMEKVATPPAWLELFEKMLSPLRYDGPFNVNHIEMPDGHTVVLEINPRFGGSLMRSTSAKELHESLTCILKHARRRA